MTNSEATESAPSPDRLDPLLAEWSSQIDCHPEQISAMWSRISTTLQMDQHPGEQAQPRSIARKPTRWPGVKRGIGALIATSLVLALGLSLFTLRDQQQDRRLEIAPVKDSLTRFSFTPEELRQTQALASEFQHLYLTQVFARRTTAGWDIEEVPSNTDSLPRDNEALVIRCLVMESEISTQEGSESWRVVSQEEVITNFEHHHLAAKDQPCDIDTWLHLLPNHRLWAECRDEQREEAYMLEPNRPSVVWEEKSSGTISRRFVIVYEYLKLDDV